MDAYGNLTTDDEFLTGRRIRLISYLDPDVAMGVTGDTDTGWSGVGVHRLSNGSPNETIFIAGVAAGSKSRMFYLAWGSDPNQALSMEGDSTGRLTLEPISQSIDGDPTYYPEFQAQWQNGPWFVLSAFGSSQVWLPPPLAWKAMIGLFSSVPDSLMSTTWLEPKALSTNQGPFCHWAWNSG